MMMSKPGPHAGRSRALALTLVSVLWGVAALGCSSKSDKGSACIDADAQCGLACSSSHPCASGLYCGSEHLCEKACTSDRGCSSSQHCGSDGRCVAGASTPKGGSGASDAGSSAGSGADDSTGGLIIDAGTRKDAGKQSSDTCRTADVTATRIIPTVVLVIDQSGSMNDPFGNAGSRWNVLRDFLLKSDGLIAMFENQVRFGIAMYSAVEHPDNSGMQECPMVTSVAPQLMNYQAISDAYRKAEPIAETPTGDAIDKIVAGLPKAELDKNNEPVVLILATDGEPDRCEELNPQNGQAEAVAAAQHAFEMGIRTYIISVGNEVSVKHQQDMANAGVGHKPDDPAPYWTAGDDASLRAALTEIIGAQVSCDVTLQGMVQGGDACLGTVELNTQKLECKGKDGWELSDPKHVRLLGKACSDFKTLKNAMVHARFPCDVQVVF